MTDATVPCNGCTACCRNHPVVHLKRTDYLEFFIADGKIYPVPVYDMAEVDHANLAVFNFWRWPRAWRAANPCDYRKKVRHNWHP
jgi:hypothetical protein